MTPSDWPHQFNVDALSKGGKEAAVMMENFCKGQLELARVDEKFRERMVLHAKEGVRLGVI